ncbi:MAG: alpha/beta hydrolase [Pseudomonadota bacterium]|uniref:alpha/beta hydrolase n=1 Tax=Sphingomonas sp. ERG5 TaxID=1381597 RepID=UPI00054B6B8E|nr:alpha/beta hydrolase [Sphingomonas sp. ERG5]
MTQHYVRPDVRAFLDILNTTPMAHLEALGVERARALTAQIRAARPAAAPHGLAIVRDHECPGPGGSIPLRFYDARETRGAGPVIIYFHGGGFVLGDLESHHDLCLEIARMVDLPVISVAYRLAPEHPWPAAPDDAEATARWIATFSEEAFGRSVACLVLAGDSSGANLAAVTAKALRDVPAAVPVVSQFLIYPTMGDDRATRSKQDFAEGFFLTKKAIDWFNGCYAAAPGNSRYDLLAGDLDDMPPTVLVTAGLDPLRDEGRAYAAALIAAGVPVIFREAKGNIHGCFGLRAAIPSSAGDVTEALEALRVTLSSPRP